MLEDLIAALIAAAATTPLVSPTLAEPIGALIDGSYNVAATPVRLVTGDIFAWWLSGAFAPFPTGLGTTFAVSLTCYLFALLAKSGEQRAKDGGALGAARLKDAHELRKGSFTWDGRSAPRGRGLVYEYRRGPLGGRYLFEPGRMAELGRRLESDGIRIARGARGGIQYRYRSKALGRVRPVSGAARGFAANRATGRGRGGSRCAASDSRWHSPSRCPAMSARTAAGAEGTACRSPLRGSAGGRGLHSAGATRERRAVLGFLLRATSKRLGMALAGAPIGAARLPAQRAR